MLLIQTLVLILSLTTARPEEEASGRFFDLFRMAHRNTRDLQCTFVMDVIKQGEAVPRTTALLRYRREPETVFLQFLDRHKGRKVAFGPQFTDGKLKVRPDGLMSLVTVSLDPHGDKAMEESIDPITRQGIRALLGQAERAFRDAGADPDASIICREESVNNTPVLTMVLTRGNGDMLALSIRSDSGLPVLIRRREGSNSATYRYQNVRTNIGLKDSDFEP